MAVSRAGRACHHLLPSTSGHLKHPAATEPIINMDKKYTAVSKISKITYFFCFPGVPAVRWETIFTAHSSQTGCFCPSHPMTHSAVERHRKLKPPPRLEPYPPLSTSISHCHLIDWRKLKGGFVEYLGWCGTTCRKSSSESKCCPSSTGYFSTSSGGQLALSLFANMERWEILMNTKEYRSK